MSNKFKPWKQDRKRFDPGDKKMRPNRYGNPKIATLRAHQSGCSMSLLDYELTDPICHDQDLQDD